VQVSNSLNNLKDNVLNTLFKNRKFSFCNILKKISARQVLEHDKVIFVVFKKVQQRNNVLVLAHFQNLNFPALLVNFNWLHVCLLNHFDCDLITHFFVSREIHNTKLSLSEVLFYLVEIVHVRKADGMPDCICPFDLDLNTGKV
jgi:hypothetical protein